VEEMEKKQLKIPAVSCCYHCHYLLTPGKASHRNAIGIRPEINWATCCNASVVWPLNYIQLRQAIISSTTQTTYIEQSISNVVINSTNAKTVSHPPGVDWVPLKTGE